MIVVLTEKQSVAKAFAKVLQVPTLQKRKENGKKEGYYMGGQYIITWCVGHLVGLAAPERYQDSWKGYHREALPMVPSVWKYALLPGKKEQFEEVKDLLCHEDVKEVVAATDCGREGELIVRPDRA